jgi:hypothetical protein
MADLLAVRRLVQAWLCLPFSSPQGEDEGQAKADACTNLDVLQFPKCPPPVSIQSLHACTHICETWLVESSVGLNIATALLRVSAAQGALLLISVLKKQLKERIWDCLYCWCERRGVALSPRQATFVQLWLASHAWSLASPV